MLPVAFWATAHYSLACCDFTVLVCGPEQVTLGLTAHSDNSLLLLYALFFRFYTLAAGHVRGVFLLFSVTLSIFVG